MPEPEVCASCQVYAKGKRVRVVNPAKERAHTAGWTGRLVEASRGPRVPGTKPSGNWGDWWRVKFSGGARLFPKDELELI